MSLRSLQKNWDVLGAKDPLWAILTDPRKKNNGWDLGEFFLTGEQEIAHILALAGQVRPLANRVRALDFGCGVGRLSQALADRFEQVRGVDISPSMIELAKKHNRHGGNCQYFLNSESNLRIFPDGHFDFIYSSITLQHIQPRFTRLYLAEFIRVLAPDGLLVFQLPSVLRPGSITRMRRLAQAAYVHLFSPIVRPGNPIIQMHGIPRGEVIQLISAGGGQVLDVSPDYSAGSTWESYRYTVAKA